MNKTNIEWTHIFGEGTGRTWNAVSGCLHDCRYFYCYNTLKPSSPLNRFGATYVDDQGYKHRDKDWKSRENGANHVAKKGEIYPYGYDPTFYPHRLDEPMKEKGRHGIFVVDTGDLWGDWTDDEWILRVLDVVRETPQNIYFMLTKNPARYMDFLNRIPRNAWLGTTVTRQDQVENLNVLKKIDGHIRFVSFEPLHQAVEANLIGIDWAIIGAESGNAPDKIQTKPEWVEAIIKQARGVGAAVFLKDNLKWKRPIREFPKSSEGLR